MFIRNRKRQNTAYDIHQWRENHYSSKNSDKVAL